jgi:hypothetical protein
MTTGKMLHEGGGCFGRTTAERADAVTDVLATSVLRDIPTQPNDLGNDIQSHRAKSCDTQFADVAMQDKGSKDKTTKLIDAVMQFIPRIIVTSKTSKSAFSEELHDAGVDLSLIQLSSLPNVTSSNDMTEIIELIASLNAISDAL